MNEREILNKFIETEKEKCKAGSGDDGFYEQQIENYIKEQNLLWMDFIKFIKEERNAEVKKVIIEWEKKNKKALTTEEIIKNKILIADYIKWDKIKELLQKLGLGK